MAERSGGDPPERQRTPRRSNTRATEIPLTYTANWWIPGIPYPAKHNTRTATKSLLPLLAVLAEGAEGAAPNGEVASGLGDAASRALFAGAQALTTNYYPLATTNY